MSIQPYQISDYYYNNPIAKRFAREVRSNVNEIWNNINEELDVILGIGYTSPSFKQSSAQILSSMQGSMKSSAIFSEDELPISNNSIDKILIIHELEYTNNIQKLCTEMYRIITPGGRLIAILPNRYTTSMQIDLYKKKCKSFSCTEAKNLFIESGFKIISLETKIEAWRIAKTTKLIPFSHQVILIELTKECQETIQEFSIVH